MLKCCICGARWSGRHNMCAAPVSAIPEPMARLPKLSTPPTTPRTKCWRRCHAAGRQAYLRRWRSERLRRPPACRYRTARCFLREHYFAAGIRKGAARHGRGQAASEIAAARDGRTDYGLADRVSQGALARISRKVAVTRTALCSRRNQTRMLASTAGARCPRCLCIEALNASRSAPAPILISNEVVMVWVWRSQREIAQLVISMKCRACSRSRPAFCGSARNRPCA